MWLILANVAFFIVAMIFILVYGEGAFDYIALKPVDVIQGKYLWTFLTSMFMHAPGALVFFSFHLFINMFVLFSLGSFCEKIIGRKRFFWFYIISGLVAGGLFVLLAGLYGETEFGAAVFGSPLMPAVGASGAIFAIAGLFMILLPKLRFSIIFFPFFSLPAYVMIPLVLFLTWGVSAGTGLPVGNTAHFGGFMSGVIYGLYLRKKYSRKVARLNRMIH
jgi:membrane associated rhomboid family serine protease